MKQAIALAEQGFAADFVTRAGIRWLLSQRLRQEKSSSAHMEAIIEGMSHGPLAVNTDSANEQHYEVPAEFFALMLGPHMKYSCALYDDGARCLEEAEAHMLKLTCMRACLRDGMDILELGCGWGSLTLAMAKRYPQSRIVAVSNSSSQKRFIDEQAHHLGLENIEVITSDMNDFETNEKFDRVVSIEMFEHMRNYRLLFKRIRGWLKDDGRLFFHIFCHKDTPYFFSPDTDKDWMARHFFTGGVMPSYDLPERFREHLYPMCRWRVSGNNYARTCQAWLDNLDNNRDAAIEILERGDNPESALIQFNRWRLFVMACRELFAWDDGNEWFVGHYLFQPQK
ncbi:MAG: class I SAM-dependent methyltransferase [Pseudomonadales bacterium]|nr:class I SAM-dependent methyltransferase [Pseudomonadales bacterium]